MAGTLFPEQLLLFNWELRILSSQDPLLKPHVNKMISDNTRHSEKHGTSNSMHF